MQILLLIFAFLLTPIILLLFFVQSRNFIFKISSIGVLLLFSIFITIGFKHLFAGVIVFLTLLILQQFFYFKHRKRVRENSVTPYLYGEIISKKDNLDIDFMISLAPFFLIKKIPIFIKVSKRKHKINMKETLTSILNHGRGTTVDIEAKEIKINFKIS